MELTVNGAPSTLKNIMLVHKGILLRGLRFCLKRAVVQVKDMITSWQQSNSTWRKVLSMRKATMLKMAWNLSNKGS